MNRFSILDPDYVPSQRVEPEMVQINNYVSQNVRHIVTRSNNIDWKDMCSCAKYIRKSYNIIRSNCNGNCGINHKRLTVETDQINMLITDKHSDKRLIIKLFDAIKEIIMYNYDKIIEIDEVINKRKLLIPKLSYKNLSALVKIWGDSYYQQTKLNKMRNIFKENDFKIVDDNLQLFGIGIYRRLNYCNYNFACELNYLMGNDNYINKETVCRYANNCSFGTHGIYNSRTCQSDLICVDELLGNCECVFLEKDKVIGIRTHLLNKLRELKNNPEENKELIEKIATLYLKTANKTHLVKDYGFIPLVDRLAIPSINEFCIMAKSDTKAQYDSDLLKLGDELAIVKAKVKKINSWLEKCIKINKFIKLCKNLFINSETDIIKRVYITSGAFNYLSLDKFINDTLKTKVFINWYKNPLKLNYDEFNKLVINKKIEWEQMGVTKLASEDTDDIIEFITASDKDNYYDFWAWFYNIPLVKDPRIVASDGYLVEMVPEIFEEYKNETKFKETVTSWLNKMDNDNIIKQVVIILRDIDYTIDYHLVKKYILMNAKQYKISLFEFTLYNISEIEIWITINKERQQMDEPIININEFKSNYDIYIQYYFNGGWKYYDNDFNKFKADYNDGWKFIKSDTTELPSIEYNKQKELKEAEKLKKQKKEQKALFAAFIDDKKESKNKKNHKMTDAEIVEEYNNGGEVTKARYLRALKNLERENKKNIKKVDIIVEKKDKKEKIKIDNESKFWGNSDSESEDEPEIKPRMKKERIDWRKKD